MKAFERLEKVITEQEEKIAELEKTLETYEYKDDWFWRQFKVLTEEENLNLPVPRLELRYVQKTKYTMISSYSIIYRHLLGDIMSIPISSTKIDGCNASVDFLPFRDGAHIYNDMYELNLRGFVVTGTDVKELSLKDTENLPSALLARIQKEVMVEE